MAKYLTIKITKCILVLTEAEFAELLARDPDLYRKAIRRGKRLLRYETRVKRRRAGNND